VALSKLKDLEADMKKCFRCSLCKLVPLPTVVDSRFSDGCPASRDLQFHGYSGSGKSIMALSLIEGRITVDEALAAITFACTTCGLCDISCKFIMEAERHLINMALREHIVEEGFGLPGHRETIERLTAQTRVNWKRPSSQPAWADGLNLKLAPAQKSPLLLLAGCLAQQEAAAAGVARKLALLLKGAGLDFAVLGDAEGCCGLPAYWTGHRDVFTKIADDTTRRFDATGAQTIIATSGSCLGAMRSKYPEYASTPQAQAPQARVLHATESLARLIEEGKLRLTKPVRRKVTYHDPCYLGRQSEPPIVWKGEYKTTHGCMQYADPPKAINRGVGGVFDEPRRILRAIPGLEFIEMPRIREYSFCCGGGGGVPEAFPELARRTALHRVEEAASVGAEWLVTACHHCRANLSNAQALSGMPALPVVDIIDLVYEAAGIEI
jgi:Fe-S oxidoreductase